MSKVEIRVRPVVRHVVTRYTASDPLPPGVHTDGPRGSLETLGEFDNERQAEDVAHALRYMAAIEPPATNLQHACHLEELSGEYGFNGYSSRFAIGDDVLYKQGTWRVDGVEFRDGKVRYHVAAPDGHEEAADSEDVYPTADWQRKPRNR
jgi:hypothetical protein